MATPFGKAVRKLRIDLGLKLKDMADELDVKSAYISALETGRKKITSKVVDDFSAFFESKGAPARAILEPLVEQSQPDCVINLSNKKDHDRELVVAFARKFSDLSDDRKVQMLRLLDMDN